MLPFTMFVYGLEAFVKTLQGVQRTADQGMEIMAGEATRPRPDGTTDEGRPANQTATSEVPAPPGTQQGGWGDLKVQATTSTSGTGGDAAEANHKEIVKMADKNLSDDQLKLVRYKILFVKRDYEWAFKEREELVPDNMTGEAFTAWKVAEFIQRLRREPIPEKWLKKDYPRPLTEEQREARRRHEDVYIGWLDEDDKKYLRVFYEVLDRYVREDEEDEIAVLQDIRKSIDSLPRIVGGRGRGIYELREEREEERRREEREEERRRHLREEGGGEEGRAGGAD